MSFLKRKPRNRRVGREHHVLDVKLRAEQIRTSRMRLASFAIGLALATLLGFYLLWRGGEWTLNALLYQNRAFAIRQIDVQTDGVIATDQLRRWAGVKTGENLFALDMTRVKRDLEMISAIRSVAVERILPHTLRLRVMEREPIAQIPMLRVARDGSAEPTVLQLDEEGVAMTQLDPRVCVASAVASNSPLPGIYGTNPREVIPGRRVKSTQVLAALQLVAAFEHSPMSGIMDLQMIDVSSPEVLLVTTSQQTKITFSLQDPDRQLRRWHDIYEQAQKLGKAIATLDLSVPDNIPARFVEASAAPIVPKRKPQPAITRKRNV